MPWSPIGDGSLSSPGWGPKNPDRAFAQKPHDERNERRLSSRVFPAYAGIRQLTASADSPGSRTCFAAFPRRMAPHDHGPPGLRLPTGRAPLPLHRGAGSLGTRTVPNFSGIRALPQGCAIGARTRDLPSAWDSGRPKCSTRSEGPLPVHSRRPARPSAAPVLHGDARGPTQIAPSSVSTGGYQ